MDAFASHAPHDRTETVPKPARAIAAFLLVGATCLMLGCASKGPPPATQNRCPASHPACQIEVVFTDVGLGERVARLDNRVSSEQPTVTYLFTAAAGETLRMSLSGVPVRLVLTSPNGQAEGPGLPAQMQLSAKG